MVVPNIKKWTENICKVKGWILIIFILNGKILLNGT